MGILVRIAGYAYTYPMTLPRLNLKLTSRGCEIELPEHGITVVIGDPRKCPSLPPESQAINTTGETLADVIPLRRAS